MKYSFMSFSCPELDMNQILRTLKLYGYEGFEPRIGAGHRHGIEIDAAKPFLREISLKARENRIIICCIATSCKFSNPTDAKDNIEYAKYSIELAAEVGSPLIRVFGGNIPEGVGREKSFESIVEALKELSEFAQQRNITVCIETHDSWSDPEAIVNVIRSVNHPAIAVNWDIMHPVLSEGFTVEKAFELLKPWIRHVHVHDGVKTENNLVFKPVGEGRIDHKSAIRLLKDSGYSGFISGEWIGWEPYYVHLPRELEAMKAYEED
jgi:sugar phosphate isomerase/epimerase